MNILITGAATGIGLATARQAIACGHNVGLFDRDAAMLTQAVQQLPASCAQHHIHAHMDVREEADWHRAFALMLERWGTVDVLINNAGVLSAGAFGQTALEQHRRMVDINCQAVLLGCHLFRHYWGQQDRPHPDSKIINLSSASAIYGQPEIATYSASKFFVRGLTEALDMEWRPQGLRVLDVMPLWVQSNMTRGIRVTSIDRLGIRLDTADVAACIMQLLARPNHRIRGPHHPVGLPARMLYALAQITPAPIVRWINRQIAAQ